MPPSDYTTFGDAQLLDERKKRKSSRMWGSFLIGFFIGVMVFAAVKKGFSVFTFAPVAFIYFIIKNQRKFDGLDAELQRRQL